MVGETWDGLLDDVDGQHVTAGHLREALEDARGGPVAEAAVGGGTGMICHGFKGGIRRHLLPVDGTPVGRVLGPDRVPVPGPPPAGAGSIIVLVATDAPLLPGQCERLAQRATIGLARAAGVGEDASGDLFLCVATGNRGLPTQGYAESSPRTSDVRTVSNPYMTPLFDAVAESTEEAILSALVGAGTMTGRDGITAYALEPALLLEAVAALRR